MKVTQTVTQFTPYGSTGEPLEIFFGFRGAEFGGVCHPGSVEDDRVLTAMAFAVINNLLTTAALIGVPLVLFNIKGVNNAKNVWRTMGFLMLASTWCCLFTFYAQEISICAIDAAGYLNIDCSLGSAGVAQVFNVIILMVICALFFILPSPGSEDAAEGGDNGGDGTSQQTKELTCHSMTVDMGGQLAPPGQVETEIHMPDGSIKRKIETMNPDGSRTVTIITEYPANDGGKVDEEYGGGVEQVRL